MNGLPRHQAQSPAGLVYRISAAPRGGLKESTPTSGPITWTSTVPGLVGLVGYVVNRLVYGGRWSVVVRPVVAGEEQPHVVWREQAQDRAAAGTLVESVADGISSGRLRPDERP